MSLQDLADAVGCAKSYLWLIEHERRDNPPGDELLVRLERALGMEAGKLIHAARWQATPRDVQREVSELESQQRAARRLAEILSAGGAGERVRLDDAYRSGELKKLIDRIAPETAERPRAKGDVARASLPLEVPLINKVAAGYPREFTDLGYPARIADEYVRCPDLTDPDAFAARVVGDSMSPVYVEGDIVVFSPARPVKDGMDCFVRIEPDHESTFKRVFFEKDAAGAEMIRLRPLNGAHAERVLGREEVAGLYAAVSVTRAV
jgi:phage repressor protein C with HTH and peptisase S24 domain